MSQVEYTPRPDSVRSYIAYCTNGQTPSNAKRRLTRCIAEVKDYIEHLEKCSKVMHSKYFFYESGRLCDVDRIRDYKHLLNRLQAHRANM